MYSDGKSPIRPAWPLDPEQWSHWALPAACSILQISAWGGDSILFADRTKIKRWEEHLHVVVVVFLEALLAAVGAAAQVTLQHRVGAL